MKNHINGFGYVLSIPPWKPFLKDCPGLSDVEPWHHPALLIPSSIALNSTLARALAEEAVAQASRSASITRLKDTASSTERHPPTGRRGSVAAGKGRAYTLDDGRGGGMEASTPGFCSLYAHPGVL
jgi:hypothetical protein